MATLCRFCFFEVWQTKQKTSVHHRGLFAKGDEACPTLCGSIIKTCKHVFATFALREIPAFAGMTSSLGGVAAIIT